MNNKLYWYRAKVLRIIDGDTYVIMMDLGMGSFRKTRLRLYGYNTPEVFGVKKESEQYECGMKAKRFVEERMLNKDVWINTHKDKTGKYGRYLAEVFYQDESGNHVSIGKMLFEEGLAVK